MLFLGAGALLAGVAALTLFLAVHAARHAPSAAFVRLKQGADVAVLGGGAGAAVPGLAGGTPNQLREVRQRAMQALAALGGNAKGVKADRASTEALMRRLRWAGLSVPPEAWQVLPFLTAVVGAVLGAVCAFLVPAYAFMAVVAGTSLGAAAPWWVLTGRLNLRKSRIAREILTYTEYLVMAMHAGAGVPEAVGQVAERFPGPVSEAFSAAVLTAHVGGRLDDGLRVAQAELDNPDSDIIIETLVKNLPYGAACANTLLSAVQSLRKERAERVIEKAGRAALLLLMPTVVFILPVVFGLVINPMFGQVMRALGGR